MCSVCVSLAHSCVCLFAGVLFLVSPNLAYLTVLESVCSLYSRSPMVCPGVESGVTEPSGDGWNGCWTLVRIILVK